jgi:hypothetical protein
VSVDGCYLLISFEIWTVISVFVSNSMLSGVHVGGLVDVVIC